MHVFRTFAETAHSGGSDPFSALGIDWKMLILQGISFLILVGILSKWVIPPLLKVVDDRQKAIEDSTKAAVDAEKKAVDAEAKVEATLKTARKEASDIVATARAEAIKLNEDADAKAKARAERIVAEAHEDIDKQVIAARKVLEKDTLGLVKKAAGLAVDNVADEKLDTAVVKKAVEGAHK